MDILIRLRVLLWTMVLALWGMMVYQFIHDTEQVPKMQWISSRIAQDAEEDLPDLETQPYIPAELLFADKPDDIHADPLAEIAGSHAGSGTRARMARIPSSVGARRPAQLPGTRMLTKPPPARKARRKRKAKPARPPKRRPSSEPTPKGFVKHLTPHFVVYSENKKASMEFLETLATLHGNLMLDLAAFSPWARDERVTIYLFQNQESYRKVTGRPAWSGGASSVKRRKIYLYASEELVGILAHELTHIYFDSFFTGSRTSPLWLSEGMATLVQTERGLAAPNWLRSNMETIRLGGATP